VAAVLALVAAGQVVAVVLVLAEVGPVVVVPALAEVDRVEAVRAAAAATGRPVVVEVEAAAVVVIGRLLAAHDVTGGTAHKCAAPPSSRFRTDNRCRPESHRYRGYSASRHDST
jgi:hypothetical protein